MRSRSDGNPTGNESTDSCCAEHVEELARVLAKRSEEILAAALAVDRKVNIDQLIEEAIIEVTSVLDSSCEGLRSRQGAHGKAAKDAEEAQMTIFQATDFDPVPGTHPPLCTCLACLDEALWRHDGRAM